MNDNVYVKLTVDQWNKVKEVVEEGENELIIASINKMLSAKQKFLIHDKYELKIEKLVKEEKVTGFRLSIPFKLFVKLLLIAPELCDDLKNLDKIDIVEILKNRKLLDKWLDKFKKI